MTERHLPGVYDAALEVAATLGAVRGLLTGFAHRVPKSSAIESLEGLYGRVVRIDTLLFAAFAVARNHEAEFFAELARTLDERAADAAEDSERRAEMILKTDPETARLADVFVAGLKKQKDEGKEGT
jgi:hypothetical protein